MSMPAARNRRRYRGSAAAHTGKRKQALTRITFGTLANNCAYPYADSHLLLLCLR